MKSIAFTVTIIACVVVFVNAGPIIDGKTNSFEERIYADGKQASNIAMAETHKQDAIQDDLLTSGHHLNSFLMRLTALIKSIASGPPPLLRYVLQGLNDGLKKGNGNLVNNLLGALDGTTSGLINGVHRQQTHDVGQILSRGRNPKLDPRAAKIIALTNHALKLAITRQAKSIKGRSNINGLLHNIGTLSKLLPSYLLSIGTQASLQIPVTTVKGALRGLTKGLKHGLGKGITNTLRGATRGLDVGSQWAATNTFNNNLPNSK